MIKIIKEGTIKELTCEHCGCLFSYEREDIKKETDPGLAYSIVVVTKEYIDCPQCNSRIELEATR